MGVPIVRRKVLSFVAIAAVILGLLVHAPLALAAPDQVSTGLLSQDYIFDLYTQVQELIVNYHTKDVAQQDLFEGMMRGLLDALDDAYSQYLDQEQYDSLFSTLEGEYSGIGVTIDLVEGKIVVVSTFPGSPAEKAGIKSADVITGAEGIDLRGKVPGDASRILRGPAGTTVTVTISRPSTGESLDFKLIRETIRQQTLSLKDLGDGTYLLGISQFTTDTGTQFPVVMQYLRDRGLRGLVLDLRNNPGGLVDSALSIASGLVPKGPLVELRRKEIRQVIESYVETSPVPVVVLVNQGSASSSEILAGAIRDRGVGVLVGDRTFGKACVQSIIPLGDGLGGIRLTTADYYTPSGYLLAGIGLTPDFAVDTDQIEIPEGLTHDRVLGAGAVGLDVLALQKSLRFLGYDKVPTDGVLGQSTAAALSSVASDTKTRFVGSTTAELVKIGRAHV